MYNIVSTFYNLHVIFISKGRGYCQGQSKYIVESDAQWGRPETGGRIVQLVGQFGENLPQI